MSLRDRIWERMNEWGITPEELARNVRWPLQKVLDLLSGKTKSLDDADLWRLALELQCTPHYLQRGLSSLRGLKHKEESRRFRTLYNFCKHVEIYELTVDEAQRLWEGAQQDTVKRRQAAITPAQWMEYHTGILGPLSVPGVEPIICPKTRESCPCSCAQCFEEHSRGSCPHPLWED